MEIKHLKTQDQHNILVMKKVLGNKNAVRIN